MGIERLVPPGRGEEFFRKMREAVQGKTSPEILPDEEIKMGTNDEKLPERKFQTGAGSMDDWQKEQERRKDERLG